MSAETSLMTLLRAACPRTYADFAPVSTQRPYVTWQQIGGRSLTFLDGDLPSKENAEIQINVWADTRAEAVTLIKQIETALAATKAFQAESLSQRVSDYDADIPVRSCRQDWSIWCDR